MIEEEELQRRELARLLSTAKDEDRKDVIRKAMSALDTHETAISTEHSDRFNMHALNPSIHASIYMGQNVSFVSIFFFSASLIYFSNVFTDAFSGEHEFC